jgi:hypothetical protein
MFHISIAVRAKMAVKERMEVKVRMAMRARKILLTLPFFLKDATLHRMTNHTSNVSFLPQ